MPTPAFGVIAPHPPIIVRTVGGSRADVTRRTLDALSGAAQALAEYAPETLVLMSPHAPAIADAIAVDDASAYSGSLAQFGDSAVREQRGDPELARLLATNAAAHGLQVVSRSEHARLRSGWLDHGSLVPLSFLDPDRRYALVVVSLSFLPYADHRAIGLAASEAAAALGRRVAFIASGDLSHRLTPEAPAGYSPRAAELDEAIVQSVAAGEFEALGRIEPALVEAGGECGLRSFIALGGFLGADPVPTEVLAYEGPWGVGYLTATAGVSAHASSTGTGETGRSGSKGGVAGADASEIVALARQAIEAYVSSGRPISEPALADADLPERAGAFVSLHRNGMLRGCIGTILPTRDSLAEEVAANAVEAATRDPRFPPVSADELADLDVKVDVLHAPSACTLEDLDPRSYGVIVTSGWRRGLLLPDLEGVDDVESQVSIAMRKAGIRPGESCSFERFKVDRYT
jgi:AmmeMemoRadiSam system protein A